MATIPIDLADEQQIYQSFTDDALMPPYPAKAQTGSQIYKSNSLVSQY